MTLAMPDVRHDDTVVQLRGRKDVIARAADQAMRAAAQPVWPQVVGAALFGFMLGAAALGGRKPLMRAAGGVSGLVGMRLAGLKTRLAIPAGVETIDRAPPRGR